ncbi:hypothetical protein FQN50_005421 [Emmonsiellopsis sp. PD_5]|nr:hypothetical protein FQN50_005421 [Emmonsiellopsis sp. PD_5]
MRPVVPDPFVARPRKSSSSSPADGRHGSPETFFLARNSNMEISQTTQTTATDDPTDSTYGVQSLNDSIAASTEAPRVAISADELSSRIDGDIDDSTLSTHFPRRTTAIKVAEEADLERTSSPSPEKHRHSRTPSNVPTSLPLTPFSLGSPAEPSSLPSSPKSTSTRSFRPSDEMSLPDGAISQPMGSDNEDGFLDSSGVQDSTPQLIMPSIKMPSRRPFTEKGKSMGRFKILLAGAAGSGKTSLIKSVVQIFEDIVHVDPLCRNSSHIDRQKAGKSRHKKGYQPRSAPEPTSITEIYASTKPYPSWWSDLEDSRVLRRRKSTGDIVLERNLCFVDTTNGTMGPADHIERIVQYLSQQFRRATTAMDSANSDIQGLLSGNGGSQVDAILYLISEKTITTDISSIRKLSEYTNVIPLISKADLLSPNQIPSLKRLFLSQARDAGVRPFLFGDPADNVDNDATPSLPFAVSSANSNDDETMDASLLMSPDYVQPLVPSELNLLLEKLFDRDNLAWLRHLAAKKLAQTCIWHKPPPAGPPAPSSKSGISGIDSSQFTSPLSSVSPSQVLVPYPGAESGPPGYVMSRVADHTQREEHMARVRLAKWASDLQQSMRNERERYESLARGERAVWLTERLGECVSDGTLLPISQTPGFPRFRTNADGQGESVIVRRPDGQKVRYRVAEISSVDPLGLIRWNDDIKRRGWILVQVIGSVGVVGGLALWIAKAWGFTSHGVSEWNMGWLSGE